MIINFEDEEMGVWIKDLDLFQHPTMKYLQETCMHNKYLKLNTHTCYKKNYSTALLFLKILHFNNIALKSTCTKDYEETKIWKIQMRMIWNLEKVKCEITRMQMWTKIARWLKWEGGLGFYRCPQGWLISIQMWDKGLMCLSHIH